MKKLHELENQNNKLNMTNFKNVWKNEKQNDPATILLYLLLSKKDFKKAVNKSFQPKNENGNSVLKSFMFPKISQYEAATVLMEAFSFYVKEVGVYNNFVFNIENIDIKKSSYAIDFLRNLKLSRVELNICFSKLSSFFLELHDEYKEFSFKNIKWQREMFKNNKKILKAKNEKIKTLQGLGWDEININRIKRAINHYYSSVNKLGSIEKRIRKTYQVKKQNKINFHECFMSTWNIRANKVSEEDFKYRKYSTFDGAVPITESYTYEHCIVESSFNSFNNEEKMKIIRRKGLFQVLFSLSRNVNWKNSIELKRSVGYCESGNSYDLFNSPKTHSLIRMAITVIVLNEEE